MPIKSALAVSLAFAALGVAAVPASANITPASTAITAVSTNATFQVPGLGTMTCASGLGFTTPSTGNSAGLTDDVPPGSPRFDSCSVGAVHVAYATVISFTVVTSTTNTVTLGISSPAGLMITGTSCGNIVFTGVNMTGTYTDGASSLVINPTSASNLTYSSTFCGTGWAKFTATYTLSTPLTIT